MASDPLTRLRSRIHRIEGSQSAQAKTLGISQSHLSLVLSGQRSVSLKLAHAIEERLGIPSKTWVAYRPRQRPGKTRQSGVQAAVKP